MALTLTEAIAMVEDAFGPLTEITQAKEAMQRQARNAREVARNRAEFESLFASGSLTWADDMPVVA